MPILVVVMTSSSKIHRPQQLRDADARSFHSFFKLFKSYKILVDVLSLEIVPYIFLLWKKTCTRENHLLKTDDNEALNEYFVKKMIEQEVEERLNSFKCIKKLGFKSSSKNYFTKLC